MAKLLSLEPDYWHAEALKDPVLEDLRLPLKDLQTHLTCEERINFPDAKQQRALLLCKQMNDKFVQNCKKEYLDPLNEEVQQTYAEFKAVLTDLNRILTALLAVNDEHHRNIRNQTLHFQTLESKIKRRAMKMGVKGKLPEAILKCMIDEN